MADKIRFEDSEAQRVSKMIKKLAEKHIVPILPNYYLVNYIIEAYAVILYQHKAKGDAIFFLTEKQIIENDPFRPSELPKTRHATSIINNIIPHKFDNRHNIGVDDQKTTKMNAVHLLNENIDSFTLNNDQTNHDNSKKSSNPHISIYDDQETILAQNTDISE
ncbi:33343_t:CDS:2, partial [Gigaspora margarita]